MSDESIKFQEFKDELKALLKKYDASLEFDFAGDLLSAVLRVKVGDYTGVLKEASSIHHEDL